MAGAYENDVVTSRNYNEQKRAKRKSSERENKFYVIIMTDNPWLKFLVFFKYYDD